jgi:hypothetical protein
VTWHTFPQPGDDPPGPNAREPVLIDGYTYTVRDRHGDEILAVYDSRKGWLLSEDDPTYGTDDGVEEPTVVAVRIDPLPRRETRTEADMAERYDRINLRLPRGYRRKLDALAEHEGQSAAKCVATWIDGAERELAELARSSR